MALSLLRRRRIAPMSRRDVDRPLPRRDNDPIAPLSDDYLVEGEEVSDRPSTTAQVVGGLQIVLIAAMTVLSLAIFWLIGLLLNIF